MNPRFASLCHAFIATVIAAWDFAGVAVAQTASAPEQNSADFAVGESFTQHIQPLLQKHCLRCHNADTMKSGIRVDQLDGSLQDQIGRAHV